MDADKIKDFFVFHVEKMIVAVVVLASAYLLYSGYGLPNYLKTHDPDRLIADASQVKNSIDENHNEAIIPDRIPTLDIIAETKKRYDPVDPTPYKLKNRWILEGDESIVRRKDPVLKAPRHLIAKGVVTAIAVRSASPDYDLLALDPADPLEVVEAPKVRERKPRGRSRGGGDDEEMMMMMMGEEDMGMDMEDEMGMDPMSMNAGGKRKFNSKFNFGIPSVRVTDDKKHPKPEIARFIAGVAVIPHKEMYRAYEEALQDADGYKPQRDTPFYFNFQVQRADVTDKTVDQLADGDWVDVWDRLKYTQLGALKWSGFAPEVVPKDYRDVYVTTWIPPVLLDDYTTFALHPLIPMKSKAEIKAEIAGVEFVPEDIDINTIFEDSNMELAGPGARSSSQGMGMEGGMMDGMDEMMDEGMMGMGMGMGFGSAGIEKDPVEYKLLRFYDFTGFRNSPQPNRKYVYRLRYAVNDPNFPANPTMQPKVSTLGPDCSQRVLDLMAKAQATKKRSFERWTEWSEPCDPVSLPNSEDYFAGPVQPGSTNEWKVAGKDVTYMRDPPTAKVVVSQYNSKYATRVPMRLEVTEGSVLSHKAEFADVVDPITLAVHKLPDAELKSPTTIVDLDGGAPLSITEGLTEPGLMLLYDASGALKVTDDVADQEFYRIYSYADERGE